ncbi:MAG: hypothetical protein DKM50_04395 [Candidatus Margulisiibacteriota bacterium]|nr:MAG: hypothetical protein A2X42_12175 [Candidatus Margulisbacteria bacterium GWF2_38_17]OGI09546.1 MAG: hypothetical protein A2X41_06380 [Candidatus Margulisbacteria bacterium GWE2_39_32]PZM81992.1 MAG: hypothetical protein DKM50_04395 [Candidatus Margulisiibacteriota bacterium]HCT85101.1 hypothetical protein [Candidatus Margulisiibacteriota bacterium]HCY35888.1 hypothetical protein [Candidatus Margulisiibacteriota bacterium]
MLNTERHLNEFLKLIRISSPSKNEKSISQYLFHLFTDLGFNPEYDGSAPCTDCNSDNIIIYIPGKTDSPVIMLSAHMDTVIPGDNIVPVVEDSYIRSDRTTILGADDKAGIAGIIEAVRILKERNIPHLPLLIVFTCAEEIGLVGAKYLNLNHHKADYCYVLDSGGDIGTIVNQAPFQESFKVEIYGQAAHAGIEPEKGKSAIFAASRAIASMEVGRIDHETTVNIGMISGGSATNIVPELTSFKGEVRSLIEYKMEAELSKIKTAIDKNCKLLGVKYSFFHKREYNGYSFTAADDPMKYLIAAIERAGIHHSIVYSGGGSDANVFNSIGIPSIVLGTGMENVHTKEEKISIKNLNNLVSVLLELATGYNDR